MGPWIQPPLDGKFPENSKKQNSNLLSTNNYLRSIYTVLHAGMPLAKSCPTLLQSHRLQLTRLPCPWDSLGKNAGAGCHALLQRIFLTQGLNLHFLCLLHWQAGFFSTSVLFSTDRSLLISNLTYVHVNIHYMLILCARLLGKKGIQMKERNGP